MGRYFWDRLGEFGNAVALVDEQERATWTYGQLNEAVTQGARDLRRTGRKLVFLFANNDVDSLLRYLSCLKAGHPVFVGRQPGDWDDAADLLEKYHPDLILWQGVNGPPAGYEQRPPFFGYNFAERHGEKEIPGHQLALLLSTSGSLGSPKLVRLAKGNIDIAASQVSEALRPEPRHRAVVSLPISFVFGLSVVNSHLSVGASLLLTRRSVQDRAFWGLVREVGVTNLSGVPWTFKTLMAISFDLTWCPLLTHLSLSGGPIDPDLSAWLVKLAHQGLKVHSMYGQTEASGRMCVLPPGLFESKPRSVGLPVKGSQIRIDADGSIIFSGSNVMLGYAASRACLDDTDRQQGMLVTGDTGYLDHDQCLYITGRTARVAKLFGLRVNLDEIEALLGNETVVAGVADEKLLLYVEKRKPAGFDDNVAVLVRRLRVPGHCIDIRTVNGFPRTRVESGSTDYRTKIIFYRGGRHLWEAVFPVFLSSKTQSFPGVINGRIAEFEAEGILRISKFVIDAFAVPPEIDGAICSKISPMR